MGNSFNTYETGTIVDARDGKSYKTLKVGDLNIMLDNLNYDAEGSACFKNSEEFCEVYGRAYDYESAMASDEYEGVQGVCPDGWHIPTADEWVYLIQNSGGRLQYKKGSRASAILPKNIFNLKLAGNQSHANDQFFLIGKKGYYMTSTLTYEGKWNVVDFSKKDNAFEISLNSDAIRERGISCRCVQYSQ